MFFFLISEDVKKITIFPTSSTAPQTPPQTPSSSTTIPSGVSGLLSTRKVRRKIYKKIGDIAEFTPQKKRLVKIIRQKEDHLRKVKSLCRSRLHDIKAISNVADSNVVRKLFEGTSSITANFLMSQIRTSRAKSARGRRWTLEDKLVALCIFKKSPRCYTLLRKFLTLPHKRTLLTLLEQVPFEAGVNEHLFKHLNEKLPKGMDRCCTLLFDEIDIQENLQYDLGSDRILGFEDYGSESECTAKYANKALVFMLVGLCKKWKQPVAFYFNNNGCNSNKLKDCIFEILSAAKIYAEVEVIATVCDMGVSNVKCLKELGVTIETPFFDFMGQRVYCMYDPPHLLKCTYSLFRKHNVLLPCSIIGNDESKTMMEARFGDIRKAHAIDKNNPYIFRTMHKIKETHMQPIMKYAMKVCVAAQVLSHTVGAFLYSLVSRGNFFLLFFLMLY